jgi:hypothetical protein
LWFDIHEGINDWVSLRISELELTLHFTSWRQVSHKAVLRDLKRQAELGHGIQKKLVNFGLIHPAHFIHAVDVNQTFLTDVDVHYFCVATPVHYLYIYQVMHIIQTYLVSRRSKYFAKSTLSLQYPC